MLIIIIIIITIGIIQYVYCCRDYHYYYELNQHNFQTEGLKPHV